MTAPYSATGSATVDLFSLNRVLNKVNGKPPVLKCTCMSSKNAFIFIKGEESKLAQAYNSSQTRQSLDNEWLNCND